MLLQQSWNVRKTNKRRAMSTGWWIKNDLVLGQDLWSIIIVECIMHKHVCIYYTLPVASSVDILGWSHGRLRLREPLVVPDDADEPFSAETISGTDQPATPGLDNTSTSCTNTNKWISNKTGGKQKQKQTKKREEGFRALSDLIN